MPVTKGIHTDSPASLSLTVKPKAKKNEEEENGDQQILLNDIYALIKEYFDKIYQRN